MMSLVKDMSWISPLSWIRGKRITMTIISRKFIHSLTGCDVRHEYLDRKKDSKNEDLIMSIRKYIVDNHPECAHEFTLIPSKPTNTSNGYTSLKTVTFHNQLAETKVCVPFKGYKIWVCIKIKTKASNSDEKSGFDEESLIATLETNGSLDLLQEWRYMCYSYWVEKYYKDRDIRKLQYYQLREFRAEIPYFRAYNYESVRSFDHVFFDQKADFLHLVGQFMRKEGIYARNIIPYRLNLLLHGRPGAGKSSVLKALANLTQRHIVYFNLPLVQTNRGLMEILHSETLNLVNPSECKSTTITDVPIKERIYVLEDIDAMSKIVQDRRLKKEESEKQEKKDNNNGNTVIIMRDKNKDLEKLVNKEDDSDALTLSGILNIFDGILELNGSILVITTNYRDKLDPALIRPGRMNFELHLDKMSLRSLSEMIHNYYNVNVTAEVLKQKGFSDHVHTPAQYEQVMMISPTVDDFYSKAIHISK